MSSEKKNKEKIAWIKDALHNFFIIHVSYELKANLYNKFFQFLLTLKNHIKSLFTNKSNFSIFYESNSWN